MIRQLIEEHYIAFNVCSVAMELQQIISVKKVISGLCLNIELVPWVQEKEQASSAKCRL